MQGCSCQGGRADGGHQEESGKEGRRATGHKAKLVEEAACRRLGLSVNTNRDGNARLSALAALITVHPVAERADAGGEGREGEIVVVPLPKNGHHVSELSVTDHAVIRCV